MKPRKSVKKFVRKHLKSAIDKRRKGKPIKNALRRKDAALEARRRKLAEDESAIPTKKKVEEMNVDELMSGSFLDDDVEDEVEADEDVSEDDDGESLPEVDEEDFVDISPDGEEEEVSDSDYEDGNEVREENKKFKSEIEKHKSQLEGLKHKDPEFYEYLKEHDQELLEFQDDDENEADEEDGEKASGAQEDAQKKGVLTSAMLDSWCSSLEEKQSFAALRKLLSAYRSACHYGEGEDEGLSESFAITNSQIFNKVMVFVLSEFDGVFRTLLHVSSEKNLANQDLKKLARWKKLYPFVKSYLVSSLHVLNQMTDNRMISYTLRRLRPSVIFLGEFSALARRYIKALLHFWGTGEESLSFIAFTLIRDIALQLGTEYLETCLKSIYKQFVANAKFVNATTLPRVQFLANCVVELYGIDSGVSYQIAFSFIRQMAIILRNALTVKSKDAFKKVYCWQYVASLELWVKVVSAHAGKDSLQPLAYPLAQIIAGVARLVPTARYFPLRMQCAVLLNRLAAATSTFVPVSSVLLDMLEFKEMRKPPTGGAGSGLNFQVILKVPKPTMKTRAFHEECVLTILEQLTEHLAQWSCSVAFPELAVIPLVQLRRFLKETNVDRFRRQAKQLIDQIERNAEFVKKKREGVPFSPKDTDAVAAFLKDEKEAGTSPLAVYCISLRQRAKDRKQALVKSSVEVKEQAIKPAEGGEEGKADELFNKKWHAQKKKAGSALLEAKQQEQEQEQEREENGNANDEDVVEDLLLSSDDDEEEQDDELPETKPRSKNRKPTKAGAKSQKNRSKPGKQKPVDARYDDDDQPRKKPAKQKKRKHSEGPPARSNKKIKKKMAKK